jgi:hypothetical protein
LSDTRQPRDEGSIRQELAHEDSAPHGFSKFFSGFVLLVGLADCFTELPSSNRERDAQSYIQTETRDSSSGSLAL